MLGLVELLNVLIYVMFAVVALSVHRSSIMSYWNVLHLEIVPLYHC